MKQLLILIGIGIPLFFLWDTAIIAPLQILVVFFHESSHAIATLLTGGTVVEMAVVRQQGGHVLSQGGIPFIIISAGYLGSLLIGAFLFVKASTGKKHKLTMGILATFILIITLAYISPIQNLFGFVFSLLTAGAFGVSAFYFSPTINEYILKIVGLTSMMYVPLDIYSDTIARSYLTSDARLLAEQFGGATMLWGGIWLIISLVFIFYAFKFTLNHLARQPEDSLIA